MMQETFDGKTNVFANNWPVGLEKLWAIPIGAWGFMWFHDIKESILDFEIRCREKEVGCILLGDNWLNKVKIYSFGGRTD